MEITSLVGFNISYLSLNVTGVLFILKYGAKCVRT